MRFTELEYLVEIFARDADDVFGAVAQLNSVSFIEWAAANTVSEPVLHGQTVPARENIPGQHHVGNPGQTPGAPVVLVDDEYFPRQWHLHNTGQSGGTAGADINAPEAWAITAGDPNIIVAVQDTGVDLNHPDLADNLVPGYDFFDNDDSPNPELDAGFLEGHGTACAGLVAAEGDNGIGVAGVAYKCKVMPIRDMTWNQAVTEADKAEAIRWSAANGADIMSYSWGYRTPRPIIHSAIKDVVRPGGIGRGGKGCVVVVAAGNSAGAMPSGDTAAYPEVIAVGATDHNDRRCWYSVYGPAIDIVAPGGGAVEGEDLSLQENVESYMLLSTDLIWTTDMTGYMGFSTFNDNPHLLDYTAKMFGTSAAAPIAAGVAALILSVDGDLTSADVRSILLGSARDLGAAGWDEYYGHGRVDARAALEMALNPLRCVPGDFDGDSDIDFEDFAIFGIHWRQLGCSEENNCRSGADLAPEIPDGVVNALDLAVFAENWLVDVIIYKKECEYCESGAPLSACSDTDGAAALFPK
ncbi:MAG: S8 family serine peptidase [Phycisphaerales bacterium]|nr:MAG: S8 family serine peptidase [Phycisphaerales bacterium]